MATNNSVNVSLSGQTGTGNFAGSNSPDFVTPNIGVASATSINFGGGALSNYIPPSNTAVPTVTFATPGDLSVAYGAQTAWTTTIGKITFINIALSFTPTYTTASGEFRISGYGITASLRNSVGGCYLGSVIFTVGNTQVNAVAQSGVNYLVIIQSGSTVASSSMTTTNFPSGGTYTINCSVAIFQN